MKSEDSNGVWEEERIIYGASYATPELHNVVSDSPGCIRLGDGKWCFKPTILDVYVPNSKWVFVGTPFIDLVKDDRGSAAWNVLGAPDRFKIILSNPDAIKAEILTGSRSIVVRLACRARHYPGK